MTYQKFLSLMWTVASSAALTSCLTVSGSLPLYGNWCGPGYPKDSSKGLAPIDKVDAACMRHDQCYDKKGYLNCECDTAFKNELDLVVKTGSPAERYPFLRDFDFGSPGRFELVDEYFKLQQCHIKTPMPAVTPAGRTEVPVGRPGPLPGGSVPGARDRFKDADRDLEESLKKSR